jgi:hypothetical protein
MCVLVPEKTEILYTGLRNKRESGHFNGNKGLLYVLVSFMPLPVMTLKIFVSIDIKTCKDIDIHPI